MRCPKCGYVSFDYNQTCPRCNKDISAEVGKLGLTSFKPEPPSLLGALTGEANESHVDLDLRASSKFTGTDEMEDGLSGSQVLEMPDVKIGEEESIDLSEGEESLDNDLNADLGDSRAFDDDTIDFDEPIPTESAQDDTMDLDLDIEEEPRADSSADEEPLTEEFNEEDVLDLELDDSIKKTPDLNQPVSPPTQQADSLELELDAISLDEDEMAKLEVNEELPEKTEPDPDDEIALVEGAGAGLGESAMIELNLDDLKIDKTGQLEIKDKAQFSEGLKKLTAKKGEAKGKKSKEHMDINLKIDDDDLNLDLEKLDLEIDIEKPENKVL
ncbi:MAG: hypothetical protein JW932_06615 [Deltaproteobacteria bacterium]|nr:hypothetical protein [Deltaproteobacteria bacterium]